MTPARAQDRLLTLTPWPQVMPRGRLQLAQAPGCQVASLQEPARRGQGRTWLTWGHSCPPRAAGTSTTRSRLCISISSAPPSVEPA